jgi:hypothetical protein
MVAAFAVWQGAAAQGALIIEPAVPPVANGPSGALSDPSIQPYLSSGGGAPFSASIEIPRAGGLPSDIFACHMTPPPNVPAKVPCRMLRMQADGSMIDISRQVFGNGPLPSLTQSTTKFVVGDFNEDGRPDIFVPVIGYDGTWPGLPPGEMNILLISNADGTYTDRSATLPPITDYSHSGCTGDIDGDGHLDIYVGNFGDYRPYFLMGKGDGTFTQRYEGIPAVVLSREESFTSCAIADLDGDGYPELVLGSIGNTRSKGNIVYYNDGKGDFNVRPRLILPPNPALPPGPFVPGNYVTLGILPLDVDHDGRLDLVINSTQNYGGSMMQILINRGDGTFADESATRLPADVNRIAGHYCTFIGVADFNGDGWEDLYCDGGRLEPEYPRLWISNGNGSWSAVPTDSLPPYSVSAQVKAIDFNGDGLPDLVNFYADTPNVFYRTNFNRTPRTVPSEPAIVSAVAGNGQVTIAFSRPLSGNTVPITGYTATCTQGARLGAFSTTGTASPITVTGLTNGKAYTCSVRASSARGNSLPSATVSVVLPGNYQGLWWNAPAGSESGWGINFAHQGDVLFATLFTYDEAGTPMWLVMSRGDRQADGATYSGTLYRTTGPAFNASPFTPITSANLAAVGTMSVTSSSADAAVLNYTVNGTSVRKNIQRQVYGSKAANCVPGTGSRASLVNYQDLWWKADESGWGVNITHQDDTIFATLFTYDSGGKGLWLVMSAGIKQADGSYLGDLYRTTGPAFNAQPFAPITAANLAKVGTMQLRFTDGQSGMLTYTVNGTNVTKAITRQVFSSPVPSCAS